MLIEKTIEMPQMDQGDSSRTLIAAGIEDTYNLSDYFLGLPQHLSCATYPLVDENSPLRQKDTGDGE
jgi:hypothetical protein